MPSEVKSAPQGVRTARRQARRLGRAIGVEYLFDVECSRIDVLEEQRAAFIEYFGRCCLHLFDRFWELNHKKLDGEAFWRRFFARYG